MPRCWLKAWALGTHWPYTTFYGPLWCFIGVVLVCYWKMRVALSAHAARMKPSSARPGLERVVESLSLYGVALVAIWFVPTVRRVLQIAAPTYAHPKVLVFLMCVCYRVQGAANALVFARSMAMISTDDDEALSPSAKFRNGVRRLIELNRDHAHDLESSVLRFFRRESSTGIELLGASQGSTRVLHWDFNVSG